MYESHGAFDSEEAALESPPWESWDQPPVIEGTVEGPGPFSLNDRLLSLLPPRHGARSYRPVVLEVSPRGPRRDPKKDNHPRWKQFAYTRLCRDGFLCQCCGCPATEVHHKTYARYGNEDIENDLASVCELCHRAMTACEYQNWYAGRVDPHDPAHRRSILDLRVQWASQNRSR